MSEIRIIAEVRETFGKGAARQIRRDGKIPGVLYGHKEAPVHVALPGHELFMAVKTANVLLSIDIEGKRHLALPKAIQRDPVKRTIEHVDLLLVRRGETVTIEIPIEVTGELAPDGLLEHTLTSLSVEAEATHIPTSIEISVQGLTIGTQILAKDVTLPAGSKLATDPEQVVLHVLASPTAEDMAGGPEAAAEGAAEAPAA
jgi:large subunit ribosomal protein L25